ncbi:MAG: leucine--tRNA ligase [Chloroflexaceae bacterium]|nr:leucine--tRNA ligase [Chloroflexaceae bacterium]
MSDTTADRKTSVRYNPAEIETKWQERWAADQLYKTGPADERPKYYILDFYPYPSGDGLSVGHVRNYGLTDVVARYYRMNGYNVLHPMGWDAFGLPTENQAIKTKTNPVVLTERYAANYKRQMNLIGASYDWSREINSSSPDYYHWTQWIFLKLYESWYDSRADRARPIAELEAELAQHGTAKLALALSEQPVTAAEWNAASPQQRQEILKRFRLAYRGEATVNWDPVDKTVLANEEVDAEGRAWRSGALVERKVLKQWFFRISAYSERLANDLDTIDWPERIVAMQRNWIGRSEGAEVVFTTEQGHDIIIFTTRPDTLWGATFMVLAPEHPLVAEVTTAERKAEVEAYVAKAASMSTIDREKEKTGVFTGGYATNPVNGERIPIWIADYVMMGYGTGAIMAVPAHDQRDFEFAKKFGLPIRLVVQPPGSTITSDDLTESWPHDGVMVNSGPIDGIPAGKGEGESVKAAIAWLETNGKGQRRLNYKMRDWLISRQRYWGTPIPIIHAEDGLEVPLSAANLPLELPNARDYEPTATGESPLALIDDWVHATLPDGRTGRRETDTMGVFACSSWYFLRFVDPHNDQVLANAEELAYWLPVDMYVGGAEHAVMHLLYARFWTKFLYDIGVVPFIEPFKSLRNQGLILAPPREVNGEMVVEKMSKSKNNVITPDEVVAKHGADALRGYECFISDFEQSVPWNTDGVPGVWRWLDRVWRIALYPEGDKGAAGEYSERQLQRVTHQTIQKVGSDILNFKFNTMVAALMEFTNNLYRARDGGLVGTPVWNEAIRTLVLLSAPVAPHLAEELWARLGHAYSVHQQRWPVADAALAAEDEVEVVVQVNGKVRDKLLVPVGAGEAHLRELALANERVQGYMDGKTARKVIVVPGKLVNIVV